MPEDAVRSVALTRTGPRTFVPQSFRVSAAGEKVRDHDGNHLGPVTVTVEVSFPTGAAGDAARGRLPEAAATSRGRLCTVSRTVQLATPVEFVVTPG